MENIFNRIFTSSKKSSKKNNRPEFIEPLINSNKNSWKNTVSYSEKRNDPKINLLQKEHTIEKEKENILEI